MLTPFVAAGAVFELTACGRSGIVFSFEEAGGILNAALSTLVSLSIARSLSPPLPPSLPLTLSLPPPSLSSSLSLPGQKSLE